MATLVHRLAAHLVRNFSCTTAQELFALSGFGMVEVVGPSLPGFLFSGKVQMFPKLNCAEL
jgi:hypothetical protein